LIQQSLIIFAYRNLLSGYEYSYEQVMKIAEDLVAEMEIVYEQSALPHKPDLEQINELCMELVEMQNW
ncbi:MAG: hypothetical protein HWQ38_03450, partial [Nostoc sp. NMS7]|nr:hypothetical protein [Nostoc sp. NMS7]